MTSRPPVWGSPDWGGPWLGRWRCGSRRRERASRRGRQTSLLLRGPCAASPPARPPAHRPSWSALPSSYPAPPLSSRSPSPASLCSVLALPSSRPALPILLPRSAFARHPRFPLPLDPAAAAQTSPTPYTRAPLSPHFGTNLGIPAKLTLIELSRGQHSGTRRQRDACRGKWGHAAGQVPASQLGSVPARRMRCTPLSHHMPNARCTAACSPPRSMPCSPGT